MQVWDTKEQSILRARKCLTRVYTSLYKKGIKQQQNKPMEAIPLP